MNSQELRQVFIQFFEKKHHTFVPGSSIVPENDPSLLFVNAGMNQFKDVFLGKDSSFNRAVNSQICIRVSGKHNDLEDVGKDLTHLTSFEMLGNWSFGDYYKKEAIEWAWSFLTETLRIPKYRLVATVFNEDDESESLWKDITDINHAQIVRCDEKDNFWEMGKTGPCGPCSEIHVCLSDEPINFELNQDVINDGRFIELWNLVFIQFNRLNNGELEPLPNKHVDTGAGFERLCAFLQGSQSNYNTDLFLPTIKKIERLTGIAYSDDDSGMPHRVIADHVRTLCFGIADNVFPSNEGKGYVLRRLLRRACRYAKKLGVENPLLYECVSDVVNSLKDHFTHLKDKEEVIKRVVLAEEESFLATLSSGLQMFEQIKAHLVAQKSTSLSGEDAFKLYDTYGFPIDLTSILAEEAGISVDFKQFDELLNKQKERSRKAASFEQQALDNAQQHVSHGQFDGLDLHLAEDLNIAKGGEARIIHDRDEKVGMARHHSATHIVHEVLRRRLGTHVHQAGSLVDSHRLRFDFSHFESISSQEQDHIEKEVNDIIQSNLKIDTFHTDLESAKKSGAMALFGEKYDKDNVRVVKMSDFSVELCAGTHVQNTEMIERIKIISETAISAGTRRVEAIAGTENIKEYLKKDIRALSENMQSQLEKYEKKVSKNMEKSWGDFSDKWQECSNRSIEKCDVGEMEEYIRKIKNCSFCILIVKKEQYNVSSFSLTTFTFPSHSTSDVSSCNTTLSAVMVLSS
ncbi:alanine--tRNA ligase [Candidatus Marinamargulisbacteria bacterium SCGC AG-343-D04]|nr:alanine--tRNA ligase [Candidatus Marinamargulisbacteria bacterium SCGC AG-343-D04]